MRRDDIVLGVAARDRRESSVFLLLIYLAIPLGLVVGGWTAYRTGNLARGLGAGAVVTGLSFILGIGLMSLYLV